MKNLKLLLDELRKSRSDRQLIDSLLFDYLLNEEDHSAFNLVSSIRKINTSTIIKIIDSYLDDVYLPTVQEIIKDGQYSLFEFEGATYRLSAIVDGSPMFTKLGSIDVIKPPFTLNDRVKRCF